MLRDGQPIGVEKRGELLERLGGTAADGAHRQRVRRQEVRCLQEIVVGILGVDGVRAHLAELGDARQRLAEPAAVLVRQHRDTAAHVVQLVEQHVVPRAVAEARATSARSARTARRTCVSP